MEIHKRTFEALKHPKGSDERIKLNMDSRTSEYMPSYKYTIEGKNFSRAFNTKKEAVNTLEALNNK